MSTKRDANDLVRAGIRLNPEAADDVTLEVNGSKRCAGLELDRSEAGHIRPTQRNASTLLCQHPRWAGILGYNYRAEAAFFLQRAPAYLQKADAFPRAITDVDQTAIMAWLTMQTGAEFSEGKVHRAIELAARENAFDPVQDYLEDIRWDGTSRLDSWLSDRLGAPVRDYERMVGPKFLISAVARVFKPGCQADHVLVLEGHQGIGKTSALRILGGPYHRADLPPLGTKDAKEGLHGAWIVELVELDSMNRSETSAVKNFLSQTEDHYRTAYGRRSETHPRRVVFAATTNESEYLRDHTGNRRFWPVECSAVDLAGLAADRDQLWAEAVARFRRGEPWYPTTRAERVLAEHEQEHRVQSDPWDERVADLIATGAEFTAAGLLERLGVTTDRQSQKELSRVGRILRRFGFRRTQARHGTERRWVFHRESGSSLSPVSPVDGMEAQKFLKGATSRSKSGDSGDNCAPRRRA